MEVIDEVKPDDVKEASKSEPEHPAEKATTEPEKIENDAEQVEKIVESAPAQTSAKKSAPIKTEEYLQNTIAEPLTWALAKVVQKRPLYPLKHIANMLVKHFEATDKSAINFEFEEERDLTEEDKALVAKYAEMDPREYVEKTCVEQLERAITEVAKRRPENPLNEVGRILLSSPGAENTSGNNSATASKPVEA